MKASLSRFAYAIAILLVVSYAFVTLRGPKGLNALEEKRTQIRSSGKAQRRARARKSSANANTSAA